MQLIPIYRLAPLLLSAPLFFANAANVTVDPVSSAMQPKTENSTSKGNVTAAPFLEAHLQRIEARLAETNLLLAQISDKLNVKPPLPSVSGELQPVNSSVNLQLYKAKQRDPRCQAKYDALAAFNATPDQKTQDEVIYREAYDMEGCDRAEHVSPQEAP